MGSGGSAAPPEHAASLPMHILGMPLDAWVLLAVSIGLGLGLQLAFQRARRR